METQRTYLQKSIDIVTSAKNEAGTLRDLYSQISDVLSSQQASWRLVITDNASTDETWEIISELSTKHNNVIGIKLSKDFGYENGILAALEKSTADICILMASDLQDSPSEITKFLEKWESGYKHVYQVVTNRPGESIFKRIATRIFYSTAHKLSKGDILPGSSTFRLLDKQVVAAILQLREKNRFLRAHVNWVGFKSEAIFFPRLERINGKSKSNTKHVIELAIRGIFSNSYQALDYVGIAGFAISAFSLLTTATFTTIWIIHGVPFAGFGIIVSLILLGFGAVFLALGVIAKYLSLIYEETKNRPNYVISDLIG